MATRHTKRNKKNTAGFYTDEENPAPRGRPSLSHMSEFDRDILDRAVHIPDLEFLFTIKQLSTMLAMSLPTLHNRILFFQGRSVGKPKPRQIVAVNVAPSLNDTPMWRVTETEFRRYLAAVGIRTY